MGDSVQKGVGALIWLIKAGQSAWQTKEAVMDMLGVVHEALKEQRQVDQLDAIIERCEQMHTGNDGIRKAVEEAYCLGAASRI
jgi:hypothetical protein